MKTEFNVRLSTEIIFGPKKEEEIQLNYSSYVIENEVVADNPTLMLLKVFITLGVQDVSIAGFDGFSADPNENYFQKGLSMGSSLFSKEKRNEQTSVELTKLMDKIKYLPVSNPLICIFSLGGFSDYVKDNAQNCKLIGIDAMYINK